MPKCTARAGNTLVISALGWMPSVAHTRNAVFHAGAYLIRWLKNGAWMPPTAKTKSTTADWMITNHRAGKRLKEKKPICVDDDQPQSTNNQHR